MTGEDPVQHPVEAVFLWRARTTGRAQQRLAALEWQRDVREAWGQRLARKEHPFPALQDAIDEVFDARIGDVSGRGKLAADMREIWMMQPRFEKRIGSTPFGLVEQPRFRAGFDFLRLRADIEEVDVGLADWWQEFSMASDDVRQDMVDQVRAEQQQQRKQAPKGPRVAKQPREPRATDAAPSGLAEDAPQGAADNGGDAPRKRKRRRRSNASRGAGSAGPAAE